MPPKNIKIVPAACVNLLAARLITQPSARVPIRMHNHLSLHAWSKRSKLNREVCARDTNVADGDA